MFVSEIDGNNRIELLRKYYTGLELDTNKVKYFSSVREEYDSLVNGVGLYPYSWGSVIEVYGKESLDYLHRISTNAVKSLPSGKVVKTLFTNEKGRLIDRTLVVNLEDKIMLLGNYYNQKKLFSWINKYIIMEDIKISDSSAKYSVFSFTGPQTNSFLMLFFGKDINDLKHDELKYLSTDGSYFLITRHKDFGLDVYSIIAEVNAADYLLKNMIENKSVFDFSVIGDDAYSIFRVEKGIPAAPAEINDNFNPYEVNIINEVNFNKGCYIGQEVIARLDTYDKVKRNLKGVIFEEDPGSGPLTLFSDANEAGKITSVVKSLLLNKYIGLASVNKSLSVDGTMLSAKTDSGNKFKVEVTALPFKK